MFFFFFLNISPNLLNEIAKVGQTQQANVVLKTYCGKKSLITMDDILRKKKYVERRPNVTQAIWISMLRT